MSSLMKQQHIILANFTGKGQSEIDRMVGEGRITIHDIIIPFLNYIVFEVREVFVFVGNDFRSFILNSTSTKDQFYHYIITLTSLLFFTRQFQHGIVFYANTTVYLVMDNPTYCAFNHCLNKLLKVKYFYDLRNFPYASPFPTESQRLETQLYN